MEGQFRFEGATETGISFWPQGMSRTDRMFRMGRAGEPRGLSVPTMSAIEAEVGLMFCFCLLREINEIDPSQTSNLDGLYAIEAF